MDWNVKESWQTYQREIIAETERFIDWGLNHPDQVTPIPFKPVGAGKFPQEAADWFYSILLSDPNDDTSTLAAWRTKLKHPARWFSRRTARQ
ncbi:MAG: hypothetical protein GY794_21665 [bacterium]|nr:hypothetical protein [bacterium]